MEVAVSSPVVAEDRASAAVRRTAALIATTKPRIIELLIVTALPAAALARGSLPSLRECAAITIGGFLTAGGANAGNMLLERRADAAMARTQNRPLVTGALRPADVLVLAIALELAGAIVLAWATTALAAVIAVAAAAYYLAVYTVWLKPRSSQNIVIGGAAGAAPPLVAWAAVTGRVEAPAVLLAVIVFLWTPPHFWALAIRYRADYAAAGFPMLPLTTSTRGVARIMQVYLGALGVSISLLWWSANLSIGWLLANLGTTLLFARPVVRLARSGDERVAPALFKASVWWLTAAFASIALDVAARR